jgi:hypothetical protein
LTVKQLQWGRFIGRGQVPVDEPYLVFKCGSKSKKKKQWGKFDCREEVPVVHHKRPTIPHLLVTAQNQQSENDLPVSTILRGVAVYIHVL